MKPITKATLIERIAARFPTLAAADTKTCVDTILMAITHALASGDRAEIRGFGSFESPVRKPRIGRNPKTGESVEIPAKRVPHFKAGKELREGVDYPAREIRKAS